MNYIKKHWRGELTITLSLWVNTILLGAILAFAETFLVNFYIVSNPQVSAKIFIISFTLRLLVVYTWQIVGVWRSCNIYSMDVRKVPLGRIVQFILVLGVITTWGKVSEMIPTYNKNMEIAFESKSSPKDHIRMKDFNDKTILKKVKDKYDGSNDNQRLNTLATKLCEFTVYELNNIFKNNGDSRYNHNSTKESLVSCKTSNLSMKKYIKECPTCNKKIFFSSSMFLGCSLGITYIVFKTSPHLSKEEKESKRNEIRKEICQSFVKLYLEKER